MRRSSSSDERGVGMRNEGHPVLLEAGHEGAARLPLPADLPALRDVLGRAPPLPQQHRVGPGTPHRRARRADGRSITRSRSGSRTNSVIAAPARWNGRPTGVLACRTSILRKPSGSAAHGRRVGPVGARPAARRQATAPWSCRLCPWQTHLLSSSPSLQRDALPWLGGPFSSQNRDRPATAGEQPMETARTFYERAPLLKSVGGATGRPIGRSSPQLAAAPSAVRPRHVRSGDLHGSARRRS